MRHIRHAATGFAMLTVMAFYVWFQTTAFMPGYPESDPDGYLILAKRIANGQTLTIPEPDMFLYSQHFWVESTNGAGVIPKFAPGLSVITAAFYRMGGDVGMFWVSPVFGALTLMGLFTLVRQWMSAAATVMTCASLAFCWMFEFYATYPLAHIVEMAFIVWGMAFLWRWIDDPRPIVAIAAGLALGGACTVRHSTAVLAIVFLPAALAIWRMHAGLTPRRRAVSLATLCVAFSIPLLAMAIYNWRFFGSPLKTGYSLTGEQDAMSLGTLVKNLPVIWTALNDNLASFILPLGLVGLVAVGPWHARIMRLTWFLAVLLVYGSYYYAPPHGGYYRFFLPLAPVLYAAAFLLIDRVNASSWARIAAMTLLAACVLYTNWNRLTPTSQDAHSWYQKSNNQKITAEVVVNVLQPNAVIFAWPERGHSLGARRSFRVYDMALFRKEQGLRFFAPPDAHTPRSQESRRVKLHEMYEKSDATSLRQMRDGIIRNAMQEQRQVAWIVPKNRESFMNETLPESLKSRLLVQWTELGGENWGVYEIVKR